MEPFDLRNWSFFRQERQSTFPAVIDSVTIDSRNIRSQNTLFVALPGKHGDGHKFVSHALENGARFAVVNKSWQPSSPYDEAKILRVDSPIHALQSIAEAYRETLKTVHLIAIAGSCGKTMLKDLLGHIFQRPHVFTSPESFNNQLGVALSILSIPAKTELAFIEMAATEEHEMERLVKMAKPDIALVTNFFRKRFETQTTKQAVAAQIVKLLESLPQEGFAILEGDSRVDLSLVPCPWYAWNETNSLLPRVQLLGIDGTAGLRVVCYFPGMQASQIVVKANHAYIAELLTIASAAAWKLGISPENIISSLRTYQPESIRTEIWKNKSGTMFVNGTYAHTLLSFNASLDELNAYTGSPSRNNGGKRLLVFGGLSKDPLSLYRCLHDSFTKYAIQDVFCWPHEIGKVLRSYESASVNIHSFDTLESAIQAAQRHAGPADTVIFKCPKKLPVDWLLEQIEGNPPNTTAHVNLAAVRSNIEMIRQMLPDTCRIMVMVKALAYGTDDIQVSTFLETCGVDILGVSYIDEAVGMRKMGVRQSIFVLNVTHFEMKKALAWNLEVGVSSLEQIEAAQTAAKELKSTIKVHLHVDTGMKRFGCTPESAVELGKAIARSTNLIFEGIFTHFCVADDPQQDAFTLHQANILKQAVEQLKTLNISPHYRHASNSSASIRFSFPDFNMVRIGLATYGIHTSPASAALLDLRPALSLYSKIVGFNYATAGDTVSYGRTHTISSEKARLAVIPIGYYDGLHRSYSGKSSVIIRGQKAPMVGRICMDYTMVDVSDIPEAAIGDEVVLFGEDETGRYLSPEILATSGGSIVHELMSCIGPRVQRLFIYDESLLLR
jgi:alanine racemase/UDP-N-acetylmuramoyl-tripeptide--D-alanyl-D-alanine ligase